MKRLAILSILLTSVLSLSAAQSGFAASKSRIPKFRRVKTYVTPGTQQADTTDTCMAKYICYANAVTDSLYKHTLASLDTVYISEYYRGFNKVFGPWVFAGYRSMSRRDSLDFGIKQNELPAMFDIEVYETPQWLRRSMTAQRIQEEFMYRNMINNYKLIDYAYWDLPVPPRLPEEDKSLKGYLKRMHLDIDTTTPTLDITPEINKRHWLHKFNTGLQFSQAYISNNWYQGGTPSLSLLFNFLWDVNLNQTYHPNLLFQSTLSYKLGVTSTPRNSLHKYLISDDVFQYNLKTGVKAFKNWFYSLTVQFKTQFCNIYPADSNTLSASFLSPSDLNVGLGMTYNKQNASGKVKFSASIAPVSFNLKTCINEDVNPVQFNIQPGHKTFSEIGSNAELTFSAAITSNISYNTRLFLFTSYKQFQGDWENTLQFRINSFLTTQIYAHLRYDTSSDALSTRWRHWMLKELLSFGLAYYFQTGK